MAEIHPQLRKDYLLLGQFKLCHLLLMNDANYPWFILVPNRDNISEIFQLTSNDQTQLTRESSILSRTLYDLFAADKINIAALGNLVPQLHVHHIVRYTNDPVWPAPVWGQLPAKVYLEDELVVIIEKLKNALTEEVEFCV